MNSPGRLSCTSIDAICKADPQIDTLVLACTHYPLLRSVIDRFIPEGITVIQQGEIVARSLKTICVKIGMGRDFQRTDS